MTPDNEYDYEDIVLTICIRLSVVWGFSYCQNTELKQQIMNIANKRAGRMDPKKYDRKFKRKNLEVGIIKFLTYFTEDMNACCYSDRMSVEAYVDFLKYGFYGYVQHFFNNQYLSILNENEQNQYLTLNSGAVPDYSEFFLVIFSPNYNADIITMLCASNLFFCSKSKNIGSTDVKREKLKQAIKILHKEWAIFFEVPLHQFENEFDVAKQRIVKFIRAFIDVAYHIKVFSENGEQSPVLEAEMTEQIKLPYTESLFYFTYDGDFIRESIKGNKEHPLFDHYLLMCRVLNGFYETVISKLSEKNQ